jgi:hypothetical protein
MAIELDTLASAASRTRTRVAASLNEAKQRSLRTAFLCHSHKDSTYVEGLLVVLQETGWNVYVDWQDTSMPEIPNQETARNIRARIEQADYFLFLATPNALASRWCPWEMLYLRDVGRITMAMNMLACTAVSTFRILEDWRHGDQTKLLEVSGLLHSDASGLMPQASGLRPQASGLRPQASGLRPQASGPSLLCLDGSLP